MQTNNISIDNTTKEDLPKVLRIFEQAMALQGKNGYKVWDSIDKAGLEKDIEQGLQYKIVQQNDMLCLFSIQYQDPFIWRDRDRNDAIYLHRIVVNPDFRGQKQFQKVLAWAKQFALSRGLKYIRMDTWADNFKIIDYYKSFDFEFIENYTTPDVPGLPMQNRNLRVTLLELKLEDK